MTVVFRLPPAASSWHDAFATGYSPLAEACFSVRVLVNPSRFRAHSGWLRTCRRLPASLRQDLRELAPLFAQAIPGFLTATTPASSSYADELARVSATPPEHVRGEVLSVLETWTTLSTDAATAVAGELRAEWDRQPQWAMDRLVDVLDRYWAALFRSEWERIRPSLVAETTLCRDRIARGGDVTRSSGMHLEGDSLVVARRCRRVDQVDLRGRRLTLAPSAFLWPRVSVESSPAWPYAVFYPLPHTRRPAPPTRAADELLPSLRALADGTRLTIVALIVERPRTTQELADLVAVSEAAVSQHLRQLRATGIVTTRREGRYVLYSIAPMALRRVAGAVAALGEAYRPAAL